MIRGAPLRMPAEWEPHRATWIGWPHHEPDWPGKLAAIRQVYGEIARILSRPEAVEILCASDEAAADARTALDASGVPGACVGVHIVPTNRSWLRDSAPTGVIDAASRVVLLNWAFNGWAKYDNWRLDARVGSAIAGITGLQCIEPTRAGGTERLVLEGG